MHRGHTLGSATEQCDEYSFIGLWYSKVNECLNTMPTQVRNFTAKSVLEYCDTGRARLI